MNDLAHKTLLRNHRVYRAKEEYLIWPHTDVDEGYRSYKPVISEGGGSLTADFHTFSLTYPPLAVGEQILHVSIPTGSLFLTVGPGRGAAFF